MDADKRKFAQYIHDHLPELLRQQNGRMLKIEARPIIEARFKSTYGWPKTLDHHRSNAWVGELGSCRRNLPL